VTNTSTFTLTGTYSTTPPAPPAITKTSTFTITGAFCATASCAAAVWVTPAGSSSAPAGYTLNLMPKFAFYSGLLSVSTPSFTINDVLIAFGDNNFAMNVSTYEIANDLSWAALWASTVSTAGWSVYNWSVSTYPVLSGTTFYYTPQAPLFAVRSQQLSTHYAQASFQFLYNGALTWSPPTMLAFTISSVTWTDTNISTGVTPIRKAHFDELTTVANNVGLFRNQACSWTDQTKSIGTMPVRAAHLTDIRTCLDSAKYAVGLATGSWTDNVITPGVTPIRKIHITELRNACSAP
jgi:hypothetical protein